jgi:hypothetical protein
MKKLLTKKYIIILGIIAFLFLIFSLIYKPIEPLPQLLTSLPAQDSQKVSLTDPVRLKFDQEVDPSLLTITSTPTEEWFIQAGDDKSIIILKSKQYFHVETKYVINISYKNEPISTLNFKTIAQQGDPRYTQEVLSEMDRDYPIAVKLPYTSNLYRVIYSAPMTLEISIKNDNILPEKAFSDIRAWVTSVGGDADAHKYVISDEPLPSAAPTVTTTPTKTSSPSPTPFNWDTLEDAGT